MNPALLFDSREAIAASSAVDFGRRKSRSTLLTLTELQQQRKEAVATGCIYVRGKTGVTVFNLGVEGPDSYKLLQAKTQQIADSVELKPAKPKKHRLIPGIGFARPTDL